MHVKICGLTTLDDALTAAEAGADYLGFNFYRPSPRYVTPEACAHMVTELARRGLRLLTVGIFVNQTPAEVATLLNYCGLDLAQLHGDEQAEHLAGLWGRAYKALRGSPPPSPADLRALAVFSPGQPAFLVDAHVPGAYGGTGQTADWEAARTLAAQHPIFLAGGLTPANVRAAVERVRPWGVDVASGVESEPGRKDPAKMRAFVEAARAAVAVRPDST